MFNRFSTFYMPTRVYQEREAVKNHAWELPAFGKKALIVTGRRSALANGSYADVTAALDREGIAHVLFSEVELAVIQNLTYRRLRIRGHTVQIKILIICQFKGFTAHHNAQLFAILSDNKDFMETDVFVYQFFRYISFRSNVLQVYLL